MARRISSSGYRSSTLLSQIASKQKLWARGIERQRREAFRRVNTVSASWKLTHLPVEN